MNKIQNSSQQDQEPGGQVMRGGVSGEEIDLPARAFLSWFCSDDLLSIWSLTRNHRSCYESLMDDADASFLLDDIVFGVRLVPDIKVIDYCNEKNYTSALKQK